jgi:hypothetical protein
VPTCGVEVTCPLTETGGFQDLTSLLYSGNPPPDLTILARSGEDVLAAPEPGTLALVGLVLGSLVLSRRGKLH